MLSTLIPHLSTLIVTVRRNMLSSIMTTFMILAIIVAWSARANIAQWLERNPSVEQQQTRFVRGKESDTKIERALQKDLTEISADRVLIRRYFDQVDPRTSMTIPYVATTHVVVAPGVSMPTANASNMPRSYITDVTDQIYRDPKNPICVHLAVEDIKDEIYHRTLVDYGVHDLYACPISDIEGAPMGMIMAGYISGKPRPSEEIVFTRLTNTSIRVAGYLAEVTQPEKEVWYRQILDYKD